MYRVVKSKYQEGYSVHKVSKVVNEEIYVEAEPILKAKSMAELKKLVNFLYSAVSMHALDKANVITVHKTVWNENEIPFYDDIADDILEEELESEHVFTDDDKAHTRW